MTASKRVMAAICLSLLVAQVGCSTTSATPPESRATVTEHWIDAGDIQIRAALYVPDGVELPIPAAVLVHGSGPSGRDDMGFYLRSALEMGLAAVAYDKRGIGESGGTYWAWNLADSDIHIHELSRDAAAVQRWLSDRPEVDATRVGYMGGSQAGWIMPQAASDTGTASFIIAGAGTPLAAGPEDAHEQIIMSGGTIAQADEEISSYNGFMGYDPHPILEALDIPMLWIFGTADWVIPTFPSIARIEAYRAAGQQNHDLLVIEGMDHNFQVQAADGVQQFWVHELASEWLEEIGIAP